ncbi:MAG: hypothetical protein QOH56_3277 [Pseudonocardiales bacterium]|jgi:hypothetical protein|nr:hypothetical protein [Pseudonocardiales bacterium]
MLLWPGVRSRCADWEGQKVVATAQEYERVLLKADLSGLASLNSQEKEMLRRLVNQAGSMGNRARKTVNG